jgi:hypothetical protein
MDRNSPPFYIEETAKGCQEAEEFVRYVLQQTPQGVALLETVDKQVSAVGSSAATLTSCVSTDSLFNEKLELSSSPDSVMEFATRSDMRAGVKALKQVQSDSIAETHPTHQPTLLNCSATPLILPAITPRFVPTCTAEMMQFLGDIAEKYGLPVQSHLSESKNEIAWVKELHPEMETYAEVYEAYKLLNNRTYMAHCCHSNEKERDLLKRTGAGIWHLVAYKMFSL